MITEYLLVITGVAFASTVIISRQTQKYYREAERLKAELHTVLSLLDEYKEEIVDLRAQSKALFEENKKLAFTKQ